MNISNYERDDITITNHSNQLNGEIHFICGKPMIVIDSKVVGTKDRNHFGSNWSYITHKISKARELTKTEYTNWMNKYSS